MRDTDGTTRRQDLIAPFADGLSAGVGSLPHTNAEAAAAFAMSEFDVATIPTLPKRSPSESMVEQGLADPLDHEAFSGVRAFLELAVRVKLDGSPVKWQFIGPVTLGLELVRSGIDAREAFELAAKHVATHTLALHTLIGDTLPNSPQLVLLDEPGLASLMSPQFPIPPDLAIDLMSSAMANLSTDAAVGIHCCAPTDLSAVLAAGPDLVSVPVDDQLIEWSGYITQFLEQGGHVAWGVVPTTGPVPPSVERPWRALSDLWCGLVRHGCDPVRLRRQSLVTPACGLTGYSVSVARQIARITAGVGRRVNEQSTATRFALGA